MAFHLPMGDGEAVKVGIDSSLFPLGRPSESQLKSGRTILDKITMHLNSKPKQDHPLTQELTNAFFMAIPSKVPRGSFLLDSKAKVKEAKATLKKLEKTKPEV